MSSLLEQANSKENREQFLNRLQKASGRKRHQLADYPFKPLNDLPDQLLADKSPEELYAEAVKNSESVNATVVEKPAAEVADYLRQLAAKKNIQNLLLPGVDQAVWDNYGLGDWYQHSGVATVNTWSPQADRMTNEEYANQADLAVGMADYLIASTGTVTVVNSPAQGRGFNFLPTRFLAIVPKSGLVRSTREAVEKYQHRFTDGLATSAITFISGPSNSGDIEMELVVGVHGPIECTYLVVADR